MKRKKTKKPITLNLSKTQKLNDSKNKKNMIKKRKKSWVEKWSYEVSKKRKEKVGQFQRKRDQHILTKKTKKTKKNKKKTKKNKKTKKRKGFEKASLLFSSPHF